MTFRKFLLRFTATTASLVLVAATAHAQSPTQLADDADQYNAYVYSYVSTVYADGIADVVTSGEAGNVAELIAELTDDGFMHCYDALVNDDDTLWDDAADDLELAHMWCFTLQVFTENSHPSSMQNQISTLMWNLEIAAENARDAVPMQKLIWPRKQPRRGR
ncbi:hypothetical protein [Roseimaritima sediminicola]|uniref:hypothetical protein n=1 Tax=Roseimaritima sediminicola TaxID=2662066 RepID=UPI001298470B|nr:hypothetical protein [Roseimaritima sediminicola]